jgi:hypothetical protein
MRFVIMSNDANEKKAEDTDAHIKAFRAMLDDISDDVRFKVRERDRIVFRVDEKWKIESDTLWYYVVNNRYYLCSVEKVTVRTAVFCRGSRWLVVFHKNASRTEETMIFRIKNEDKTIPSERAYEASKQ